MEIPEDVAMDILLKLPVKSLFRFRCVCKSWSSSFQTPQFIAHHHQKKLESNNLNLLVRRSRHNKRQKIRDFFSALSATHGENYFVSENIHLPFCKKFYFNSFYEGHCNGLVCLTNKNKTAIWNPSTREFKILPKSTFRFTFYPVHTFDSVLGFGFDSRTGDYKVIRFKVKNFHNWLIYDVELCSLKSDSWKELPTPSLESIANDFPLRSSGFCFWCNGYGNILSFDMTKEEFSILPPPDESIGDFGMHLLDFNGSLGAFVYDLPEHVHHVKEDAFIDLWVMNGLWIKQYRIEQFYNNLRPLGLWKNDKIFIGNHYDYVYDELKLFDPLTRELKNLGLMSCRPIEVITYVESLVSINGRLEQEEGIKRQPGRIIEGGPNMKEWVVSLSALVKR